MHLTGPHVAHPALVPQVAHLRLVAARRPVLRQIYFHHWTNIFPVCWGHLVVALEGFELVHGVGAGGGPHPLHCLPGGHHPDVLHRHDRVQEQLEPLLVVRGGEPAGDSALVTVTDPTIVSLMQNRQ